MDAVLLIVVSGMKKSFHRPHKDQEYFSEGDCMDQKRRDRNIPRKYIVDYIYCLITKLMSHHSLILSNHLATRSFIAIM